MGIEKFFVIEFKHRQIDQRRNCDNGRRDFISSLVVLYLNFAGVDDDMGVRENSFSFDYDAAASAFSRRSLFPRLVEIGTTKCAEDFDDRAFHCSRWCFT